MEPGFESSLYVIYFDVYNEFQNLSSSYFITSLRTIGKEFVPEIDIMATNLDFELVNNPFITKILNVFI